MLIGWLLSKYLSLPSRLLPAQCNAVYSALNTYLIGKMNGIYWMLYSLNFRTIGDLLGEAKASGNLGNTLKVLGNFEEAIVCCQRHLDISQELNDKVRIGITCFAISLAVTL